MLLSAGVLAAALMFPFAAVIGLFSNRAADVVANGSAQLVEGDVPAGLDDGGRRREPDRVAVFSAPIRSAYRSDRQHHEVGDRLD